MADRMAPIDPNLPPWVAPPRFHPKILAEEQDAALVEAISSSTWNAVAAYSRAILQSRGARFVPEGPSLDGRCEKCRAAHARPYSFFYGSSTVTEVPTKEYLVKKAFRTWTSVHGQVIVWLCDECIGRTLFRSAALWITLTGIAGVALNRFWLTLPTPYADWLIAAMACTAVILWMRGMTPFLASLPWLRNRYGAAAGVGIHGDTLRKRGFNCVWTRYPDLTK